MERGDQMHPPPSFFPSGMVVGGSRLAGCYYGKRVLLPCCLAYHAARIFKSGPMRTGSNLSWTGHTTPRAQKGSCKLHMEHMPKRFEKFS